MNFLIVNQPLNNRGDESAHKALVRAMLNSLPEAKINVLFIGRNQDSVNQYKIIDNRVKYVNVEPLKGRVRRVLFRFLMLFPFFVMYHPTARKIIPFYKNADIIMCAPGGICMGGFQNWEHIWLLIIAKYLKKPTIYYGRSIGPFPITTYLNRIFRKQSIKLLNYFSFISLRDSRSANLADLLNVKYEKTVDSAFLESPCAEIPNDVKELIGQKPYVVFVPNKLIWHYAYKGKVSLDGVLSFYKKILDVVMSKYPEYNIVMLPQTFNFDNCNKGDINFFKDLKQYTNYQNLIIVNDIYSSDIQQTIISKSDCVIGARYHSIVFAINQAVPFVALSYEHKIMGLLESLHKTDFAVDISSSFDSDENMKKTLSGFSSALNQAYKDEDTQKKAKKIAEECFAKFQNKIIELV